MLFFVCLFFLQCMKMLMARDLKTHIYKYFCVVAKWPVKGSINSRNTLHNSGCYACPFVCLSILLVCLFGNSLSPVVRQQCFFLSFFQVVEVLLLLFELCVFGFSSVLLFIWFPLAYCVHAGLILFFFFWGSDNVIYFVH